MNATLHNQHASSNQPGKPPAMPLWKQFLAFGLGLMALFLGTFLEDRMGRLVAVIGMGAYFLIGQFLLSRGNPFALLDDGV